MEWRDAYTYQVAGRKVSFDRPVQRLSKGEKTEKGLRQISTLKFPAGSPYQLVEAEGWLLDSQIHVKTHYRPEGVRMEICGSGEYAVDTRGNLIEVLQRPADELQFEQSLLGPPLILALALQGVWCLHASAVSYQGNCLVFLGDSGRGKSTLAAYLAGQSGFSLVSDDILPIEVGHDQVRAYADFPQLKLPEDERVQQQGGAIPVQGFFLLEDFPQLALKEVEQTTAVSTLVHNTAAARTFSRELLTQHLDACVQAAGLVPVFRLGYPRDYDRLPDVADKLKVSLNFLERSQLEYQEEG